MEEHSFGNPQDSGSSSVPTFLLKLLNMLDDESNHAFIDWSSAGTSFIVKEQVQFSKVVLPKYFKHNKFASFVRQLNMYGFRKITSLTQSGLNPEKEEVEFYHYLFIRGEEHLLEQIKRKVNKADVSHASEDVNKVLADVKQMRNYQESVNARLTELKQENEDLWREIVNLRQKHAHQQTVVNKLIQFLVNLVHQTGMGMKRKLPLMIEDGSSGSTSYPSSKFSKQAFIAGSNATLLALQQSAKPTVSFPPSVTEKSQENNPPKADSGPYITELTAQSQHGDLTEVYPQPNMFDFDSTSVENPQVGSTFDQSDNYTASRQTNAQDDLGSLIQSQSYESSNDQTQPLAPQTPVLFFSPPSKPAGDSPTKARNEIARYEPRSPRLSPSVLNSHVDMVQNNLVNIQDMLFNNDQVQLDYGLIQELFSTSPDIMPPADVAPSVSDASVITGNEIVLHSDTKDADRSTDSDLSDLTKYIGGS